MATDEPRMRLELIPDRCQGHNRCRMLAPELVEIDELGFALIKGDGTVSPDLTDKARLAVKNCPEFALRLATPRDETP